MKSIKVFVSDTQKACIVCANCGRHEVVNAAPCLERRLRVKARCGCGHVFNIAFERRKAYRKRVDLPGQYSVKAENMDLGAMVVQNISKAGIGFRTSFGHNTKVGDMLEVTFSLDDPTSSRITKKVVVKNVNERFVRAEFYDSDFEKALGYYMLP